MFVENCFINMASNEIQCNINNTSSRLEDFSYQWYRQGTGYAEEIYLEMSNPVAKEFKYIVKSSPY